MKTGARPSSLIARLTALLAVFLLGGFGVTHGKNPQATRAVPDVAAMKERGWKIVEDGVERGDVSQKRLALIFTGGEHGEGTEAILDALKSENIGSSFFVTGDYLRNPELAGHVKRMLAEGHYVGPHSDSHPLYCPWEDRKRTLVTREFFREDLQKNIDALRALGALQDKTKPVYFIPPSEWYNADQAKWSREMGVLLFNFTPGSGSNRDWAPEGHKSFAPSQKILDDLLAYERDKDPDGFNGFLLLLHLGSQRRDKMHPMLPKLLKELKGRGYEFSRIDELLVFKCDT